LLCDRNILLITPDGPLEKADFEQLAREIDPVVASKGKLAGLMIYTKSFPGWRDFDAFASHIRFVAGHHRRIERIAAVTGGGVFMKVLPWIANFLVQADVRHFSLDQKDQALVWLEAGR
jgi:hypothetical protein